MALPGALARYAIPSWLALKKLQLLSFATKKSGFNSTHQLRFVDLHHQSLTAKTLKKWWFSKLRIPIGFRELFKGRFLLNFGVGYPIMRGFIYTLQGTNISPKNGILKMIFLFPRWDMLVPWRVHVFLIHPNGSCFFKSRLPGWQLTGLQLHVLQHLGILAILKTP